MMVTLLVYSHLGICVLNDWTSGRIRFGEYHHVRRVCLYLLSLFLIICKYFKPAAGTQEEKH